MLDTKLFGVVVALTGAALSAFMWWYSVRTGEILNPTPFPLTQKQYPRMFRAFQAFWLILAAAILLEALTVLFR